MKYLCIVLHNIAVLAFTAYMVVNVHPIWAFMIVFLQTVRDDKVYDYKRDVGTEHFED